MKHLRLFGGLMVVMAGLALGWAAPALAGPYPGLIQGRGDSFGYFTNIWDCGGHNVWPSAPGVDAMPTYPNADAFIADVENKYYFGNAQQRWGAAFIIQTMRGGVDHTDVTGPQLTDWVQRVKYAESQGWIQWNTLYTYTINTRYQGPPTNAIDTSCGGGANPIDDAYFGEPGPMTDPSIVFRNPATGEFYYALRLACANPLGNLPGIPGLPPANYDVTVTADRNGSAYTIVGGKTYTLGAQLHNNGPANAPGGTLQVNYPGASVQKPCPANCALPNVTTVGVQPYPPGQDPVAFGLGSKGGFNAGNRWFWTINGLNNGAGTNSRMSFTVNPAAPVGSIIHFDVGYGPADQNGAWHWTSVEYIVVSERTPGVTGANSDIHAGGGICKQATGTGFVKGYPGSTSQGEYVVSASAANGINNFKSNGAGADTLKLGSNGGYAQVCRPDLVAAAQAYRNAGAGYNTTGAADVDVTGRSGVLFLDAGVTTIHGVISQKLTLVALSGKVVISGPITIDGVSHPARDAPSLGVIASGNIEILAAVTRVDAYLFSNATIDTCQQANTLCSTPTLLVNGFLMARNIAFHRLGPFNTNGTPVAEQVVLNPQIYLNPPRLMDASVDDNLLQGQGEKPPLF